MVFHETSLQDEGAHTFEMDNFGPKSDNVIYADRKPTRLRRMIRWMKENKKKTGLIIGFSILGIIVAILLTMGLLLLQLEKISVRPSMHVIHIFTY